MTILVSVYILHSVIDPINLLDRKAKLCYSMGVIIDRRGHTGFCSGQASVNGDFSIYGNVPFRLIMFQDKSIRKISFMPQQ